MHPRAIIEVNQVCASVETSYNALITMMHVEVFKSIAETSPDAQKIVRIFQFH